MMKKTIFAVVAGAAVMVATGCVSTVSDTHTFATSWNTDSVSGRYNRSPDQVYDGFQAGHSAQRCVADRIYSARHHEHVRSLEGRVNNSKVWVRVEAIDQKTTQVDVQARSSWGTTDVDLVHELEKEIALQLAR